MEVKSGLSPVDIYVGARIRDRRVLLGISQEHLGAALGVSPQQVNKYEGGINRVAASSLFNASRLLDVLPEYFFADMPDCMSEIPVSGPRGHLSNQGMSHPLVAGMPLKREVMEWVNVFYKITDQVVRQRVFDLIKSLPPKSTTPP